MVRLVRIERGGEEGEEERRSLEARVKREEKGTWSSKRY
jgi:hypothetical protein